MGRHLQYVSADRIIAKLYRDLGLEDLNETETQTFIKNAFRDGFVSETGTAITKLLPPLDPFAPNNQYAEKKITVIEKLKSFLNRFLGI